MTYAIKKTEAREIERFTCSIDFMVEIETLKPTADGRAPRFKASIDRYEVVDWGETKDEALQKALESLFSKFARLAERKSLVLEASQEEKKEPGL